MARMAGIAAVYSSITMLSLLSKVPPAIQVRMRKENSLLYIRSTWSRDHRSSHML
ncbi:hypothetical protein BDV34DRAFT_205585 [Aspergillus parasiticus]|uniref:Uncharacterized protein n=1 Tax=Aspergillus parasiticus TaxID=5067 RepID=A0A5N6D536_ASPPA|nr:hypothetical protein BDV34DRAFT_205585 [Aspergillus parasiticus]